MAARLKDKLRQRLGEARAKTLSLIKDLSPAELERASTPHGWTARDILAHLALSEADHRMAIDHQDQARKLAEDGFDLNAWNARRLAEVDGLSVHEILERLAQERAVTLALLEATEEATLAEETIFHPVFGELEVGKVFRIIAYHERMHHTDLVQALRQLAQQP